MNVRSGVLVPILNKTYSKIARENIDLIILLSLYKLRKKNGIKIEIIPPTSLALLKNPKLPFLVTS